MRDHMVTDVSPCEAGREAYDPETDTSGGWRPNARADEAVSVPYDIDGHRL